MGENDVIIIFLGWMGGRGVMIFTAGIVTFEDDSYKF
jgi:hypothetical protein